MSDPFQPPGVRWTPVSPRLATARLVVLLAVLAVLALAAAGLAVLLSPLWWLGVGAAAAAAVLGLVLVPRAVRSWGYAEREDDLLVRRGLLLRALVVVPYGRMQYVEVSAGPLDRRLGIATLQLHTASASTDAAIPGLPPAEAARLRDRLAERGEARLAGL